MSPVGCTRRAPSSASGAVERLRCRLTGVVVELSVLVRDQRLHMPGPQVVQLRMEASVRRHNSAPQRPVVVVLTNCARWFRLRIIFFLKKKNIFSARRREDWAVRVGVTSPYYRELCCAEKQSDWSIRDPRFLPPPWRACADHDYHDVLRCQEYNMIIAASLSKKKRNHALRGLPLVARSVNNC